MLAKYTAATAGVGLHVDKTAEASVGGLIRSSCLVIFFIGGLNIFINHAGGSLHDCMRGQVDQWRLCVCMSPGVSVRAL